MLENPTEPFYGLDLMDRCGVKSGTLYPLLARLAASGWLVAEKEALDPRELGRPVRTYYRLTGVGASAARQALAEIGVRAASGTLGLATS